MVVKRFVATANPAWVTTSTSWSQCIAQLKADGADVLGEGTFSVALVHPKEPNSVLKVSRLHTNTNALYWLTWCKANPSKYVPKVYDLDLFICDEDQERYMVARIEKFEANPTFAKMLTWCASVGLTNFKAKGRQELELKADSVAGVQDPKLSALFAEILRLAKNGFVCQDLTPENLFLRNNDIVFVDPITGGNTY